MEIKVLALWLQCVADVGVVAYLVRWWMCSGSKETKNEGEVRVLILSEIGRPSPGKLGRHNEWWASGTFGISTICAHLCLETV
jgi:hypothetical protein